MFEHSKWIKYKYDHIEGLQLRKEFFAEDDVLSATLSIIGLGYGVYFVNGKEVTKDVLSTQFTNFDKRILYNKYDVIALLVGCKYFTVYRLRIENKATVKIDRTSFHSLIVTEGSGVVHLSNTETTFDKGDSIFIPAQNECYEVVGECEIVLSHM